MTNELTPLNISLHTYHTLAIKLIEDIKSEAYSYKEVTPNISIIEYMFLHYSPERIICKVHNDKDYKWEVFYGSVLLNTLDYYVVKDNPLEGLKIFTEFNGCKLSELPVYWTRYINESQVTITIEESYKGNEFIENYLETLKGYAEG